MEETLEAPSEASANPSTPFILKIKGLKLKGKNQLALTYFQDKLQAFGKLGCDKGRDNYFPLFRNIRKNNFFQLLL